MNALNNINSLMVFGKVIKGINALGLNRYVAQIVIAEKTESDTLIEILKTEALTRNEKKVLNLAQVIARKMKL